MPEVKGYFRSSYNSYSPWVAFTDPGWTGEAYPENGILFSDALEGTNFFYTDVNGVHHTGIIDPPFKSIDGKVYCFKLIWDNKLGTATLYIKGIKRGELPAPTISEEELPLQISQPRYYSRWLDVPEYRNAAMIIGGLGTIGLLYYIFKKY